MIKEIDYLYLPKKTVLNNRYVIRKRLSDRTNFSIPYLAYDKFKDRKVVIKEFFPKDFVLRDLDGKMITLRDKKVKDKFNEQKKIFTKETRIISKFSSENIVECYNYFVENKTCYIVLKYYPGPTLKEYISNKKIKFIEFISKIFVPLLDAVALIHRQNFIHGDLKPENIIISEGRPVILDFGSAIKYKQEKNHKIFISPGYSPLEFYATKSKKGPFSDIYSLSAILYYYLTNKLPPAAPKRIFETELAELNKLDFEMSNYFSKLLLKNFALEANKRDNKINIYKKKILIEYYRQRGIKILKSIFKK